MVNPQSRACINIIYERRGKKNESLSHCTPYNQEHGTDIKQRHTGRINNEKIANNFETYIPYTVLRLISKIVHDLSSRFPDYAISRTRKGERKRKRWSERRRKGRDEEEWNAPVALSKRNTGFCSPFHVHVYIYIYVVGHMARVRSRERAAINIRFAALICWWTRLYEVLPTGSTRAWYSSNGNKTRVEQRWATWTGNHANTRTSSMRRCVCTQEWRTYIVRYT